ncbi:hypothetical protein [Corynebacterium mustelae]|uniref:hypothetical protein n=1 Tax=Corynebacterium mustelae TaxID=571915 RepID=UPI0006415C82|nr:hypothetical protein [Corynebacterium mustelae]
MVKLNPQLFDAVAVFRELGWDGAEVSDVLSLPLGTSAQRARAVAGLQSGQWYQPKTDGHAYWYEGCTGVREKLLALFAVRCGVTPSRAAEVLESVDTAVIAAVVAERGADFAQDFIACCGRTRRRLWTKGLSTFGTALVFLVHDAHLPVPQDVEYLTDWSIVAARQMFRVNFEEAASHHVFPPKSTLLPRFLEHVRQAITAGVAITGPFGMVFTSATRVGRLERETAVDLAFSGLSTAIRPSERKEWAKIIVSELRCDPTEMLGRVDEIVPLVATGETTSVESFGIPLLSLVDDMVLPDLALAALYATAKKTLHRVIRALADRPVPSAAVIDALQPRLSELAQDASHKVAADLLASWGNQVEPEPKVEPAIVEWPETPPVWQLPAFHCDDVDVDKLVVLASRDFWPADVETERFFAALIRLAHTDLAATRAALRRCDIHRAQWKDFDEEFSLHDARTNALLACYHQIPCSLSTPSFVDLSITVADFAQRVREYAKAQVPVLLPDLVLALCRLRDAENASLVTIDPTVRIKPKHGMPFRATVAEVFTSFTAKPVESLPKRNPRCERFFHDDDQSFMASVSELLELESFSWCVDADHTTFPTNQTVSGYQLLWEKTTNRSLAHHALQVARSEKPFAPHVAINLLAVCRATTPEITEQCVTAALHAWQRGLIRPGATDFSCLDWAEKPSNVPSFVAALVELSPHGLLPVTWLVFDQILAYSARQPRLIPGTEQALAALEKFLPSVIAAVSTGHAPREVLTLPGLRAVANRRGTTKSTVAARRILRKVEG